MDPTAVDNDLDFLFADSATGGLEILDWSPDMDWDDDFPDLMDLLSNDDVVPFVPPLDVDIDHEPCHAFSSVEGVGIERSKGVRLFHLLMAAAEAIDGASTTHELAKVILARLKEMVDVNNGTNMDRLASHFTDGLTNLVEKAKNPMRQARASLQDDQSHHPVTPLAAFQFLQQMTPYVNFGYFTANQAILEAGRHERRVHVVDYDVVEGVQWASLIQAMKSNGHSVQHLRITAISRPTPSGRKVSPRIHEVGRRLSAFAESVGQPFSFHICKLEGDTFHPSSLKLVRGEALIINCMLHLPRPCFQNITRSLTSFMSEARNLNPRLVTMVEEEAGLGMEGGFRDRIVEALHHYSAMYESLELGSSASSKVRGFVDQTFLGPWISGSVVRVAQRQEEDGPSSMQRWVGENGFKPVAMSFANQSQAKLLLGLFGDGYKVESAGNGNRLVLGWKSRPLVSASLWTYTESDF